MSSVDNDIALRSIDKATKEILDAAKALAPLGKLAEHLLSGGTIHVQQHSGLCIGAPLGLNLTPSQCDEIGKFVASAIASGALRVARPIEWTGVCRECGCTDMNACLTENGACSWVNPDRTLCSKCSPVTEEQEKRQGGAR